MDPNSTTPGHIIIKMLKVKDNERILKAARENGESYLQRSFHKTISLQFLKRNFAGKKGLARNIQSHGKQVPMTYITLPSKAIT